MALNDFKDKSKPLPGTSPIDPNTWDPMQFDQQVSLDNRLASKQEPHETAAYEAREQRIADQLCLPLYVVAANQLAGPSPVAKKK
jgi:hypothetical protein